MGILSASSWAIVIITLSFEFTLGSSMPKCSRGSLQAAVEAYQQLVTLDPYREPAHRELMRCHFRLGDRVAAIKQYQTCVQILRDDLGLSPTSETEELYLQIIG